MTKCPRNLSGDQSDKCLDNTNIPEPCALIVSIRELTMSVICVCVSQCTLEEEAFIDRTAVDGYSPHWLIDWDKAGPIRWHSVELVKWLIDLEDVEVFTVRPSTRVHEETFVKKALVLSACSPPKLLNMFRCGTAAVNKNLEEFNFATYRVFIISALPKSKFTIIFLKTAYCTRG
jgi:hypothetical protein